LCAARAEKAGRDRLAPPRSFPPGAPGAGDGREDPRHEGDRRRGARRDDAPAVLAEAFPGQPIFRRGDPA
jgi:hypothetical protein